MLSTRRSSLAHAHAISIASAAISLLTLDMHRAAVAGPAVNQFEVKDLESGPGDFEFQSQNAFVTGQPRRRVIETAPGEFAIDDNTVIRQREALEIQLGITDYFRVRVGIEYEQERFDQPPSFSDINGFDALRLEELALEAVVIFVKPHDNGVGFGWLVEYGRPVTGEAEAQEELYLGPIVEARFGPWSAIGNFAFVKFMGGEAEVGDDDFVKDEKWDFSYFVQGAYRFSENWNVALEAYGTFDRLGNSGTPSEASELFGDFDQHRAGPVVYYTFFPLRGETGATLRGGGDEGDDDVKEWAVTVGAGALFGLNENTADTTYKLSVEVEY